MEDTLHGRYGLHVTMEKPNETGRVYLQNRDVVGFPVMVVLYRRKKIALWCYQVSISITNIAESSIKESSVSSNKSLI